jgi:hypothetical protein
MRGIERLAHVLRGEKWAYLCPPVCLRRLGAAATSVKTRFSFCARNLLIVTTFFLRETLRAV